MAVRRYDELIAWQLAEQFRVEVLVLVRGSASASSDLRFRDQLLDAASAVSKDIAEGFVRYSAAAFIQFLGYALGSLVESEQWLKDGIDRGYFDRSSCEPAFRTARRCLTATVRLRQSQERYLEAVRLDKAVNRK